MRKFVSFLSSGLIYLSVPALSFAASTSIDPCQSTGGANAGFSILCKLGKGDTSATTVGGVLGAVITMMFVIAAIVALWFLVQGGLRWITSQGDTKNVEGARNQIIAAAVGLAVTFLSYLIINILLQFFLNTSLNGLQLPHLGS
jgi:hypothetical protein